MERKLVTALDLEDSLGQQYAWKDEPVGLDLIGDMTMEVRVKPENIAFAQRILVFGNNSGLESANEIYAIYSFNGSINYSHEYGAGTAYAVTLPGYTLTTGTWTDIAIVRDTTAKTLTLYINGSSTPVYTITYANNPTGGSAADLYIGTLNGVNSYFDGLIDEVRIWNDIRTGQEIMDNYGTELTGTEAGLVGYWKLNDVYTDETTNGNTLTPVGGPVFVTE